MAELNVQRLSAFELRRGLSSVHPWCEKGPPDFDFIKGSSVGLMEAGTGSALHTHVQQFDARYRKQ